MRCYDCNHWRKKIGTEKWGECHVDGPSMSYYSGMGRWPLIEADEDCGRYQEGEERIVVPFNELVEMFEKREK